jgi:hypothetical protein
VLIKDYENEEIENPVGVFTSILDGLKTNPQLLDRMFTLLENLQWNGNATSDLAPSKAAYSSKTIRSLKKLYAYYYEREEQMEQALLAKCSGAQYFKNNLAGKLQSEIFDILAKEVKVYLKK